jgi:nucleoside-diphosphate-sugar epimerase
LYVDDAIKALLLLGAVEKIPSRIYNAGGPRALAPGEIAAFT